MPTVRTTSLAVIVSTLSLPVSAAEPPRMVLMDLQANAVSKEVAQSLTDLLDLEIERSGLYTVFSQQDLRAMMAAEEQKQLLGVEDPPIEVLARIGKAVNAPYLLRGSVGKVGNVMVVSLDLIDVKAVKAIRRVNQTLVGDESSLVGSVRAAALALALEEKGMAPDVSAELIDGLKIAEKPKTLFLSFSPGYEIPVGPVHDSSDILYFMPALARLRLDVEYPVWKFIRLFASTGYDMSVASQMRLQDKHYGLVYDGATAQQLGDRASINTTTLDYQVARIPFDVGAKFVSETGRFLPFGLLGLGVSWQKYSFSDEKLGMLTDVPEGGCVAPAAEVTVDGKARCKLEIVGKPEKDISSLGLDFVAGAGVEWLLTHHLGIKVEGRYVLTYLFKGKKDLDALFISDPINYSVVTPKGSEPRQVNFGDMFPVRQVQHGISASAGVVYYW